MPDDLPLAGTPGRVSPAAHIRTWWQRLPLWDLYFGLVAVATTTFVLATDTEPVAARAQAVALLVVLVAWHVLRGRPLMRAEIEDWRGLLYLAGVTLLYVPAVALVGTASVALMALCPQAYMLMPALRATGAVVVFNLATVSVAGLRTGDLRETLEGPVPVAVMVILGSAIFGTWARRVSQQNEERARLIEQLNGSRAEVARLSHEAGVATERQRLAGELHDTVAQGLSSVVMLIQAAEAELDRDVSQARRHLQLAVDTARDNLAEARALVGALIPSALANSSLGDALARLVDRFRAETGVRGSLLIEGHPCSLPTAVEVMMLRAAQEALANVRKHAGATTVSVRLRYGPDTVVLEVSDDGCGFNDPVPAGGYGLRSMRSRVEQVSGRLTVESVPGRGTTLRVEVTDP
ncbi:MAG TPA: sensor histidine kinase [Micromonosporaceae bacterium]|nr:sensor histidine kinase [Micromonosporaceae bacterium]